jgi:hypothetical protein
VTTVSATDPDAGTTITYSISGGADASKFQINGNTGVLSFKTAPNYESPTDSGRTTPMWLRCVQVMGHCMTSKRLP